MSQSNQKGNIPSTESLSISASIFLSSIDSWIPPTFGTAKSNTNNNEETSNNLLVRPDGVNETNDRLGLGHPSYNQPSNQRTVQRNGLIGLNKKLNLEKKNQVNGEKDNVAGNGGDQDSDDEEESRVRSLAKKKNTFVDPFGGKAKKKKKDPFAVGNSNPKKHNSPILSKIRNDQDQDQGSEDENNVASPSNSKRTTNEDAGQIDNDEEDSASTSRATTPPPATSSPGESGTFPYDGPRPFGSPSKSKSKVNLVDGKGKGKRLAEQDDDDEREEEDQGAVQGNGLKIGGIPDDQDKQSQISGNKPVDIIDKPNLEPKSKTKIRRENRKRAKLLKSQ